MPEFTPRMENLVRSSSGPAALAMRDAGPETGDGRTMFGHFAVTNQWTEINSAYEGRFRERVAPGAMADLVGDNGQSLRVLYDHGHDPHIGSKPIASINSITEDKRGYAYDASILDVGYANDLIPALRAGQLGASFRFNVPEGGDTWVYPERSSKDNPMALPERTITRAKVLEFGPTPFGAYAGASAGVRSTDDFLDFFRDPIFVARFTERCGIAITERILAQLAADGPVGKTTPEQQQGTPDGLAATGRSLAVAQATLLTLRRATS